MEYWKQIEGYPHLLISRAGKVWTTTYNRELHPHLTNRGYLRVNLSKDKTVKRASVHRLVAEAFIPNPDNLPTVDHIDGNKLNNCVENLQWLSQSDNCRKAVPSRGGCIIPIVCVETGKVYKSMKQAAEELNIPAATMSAIIKGEYDHYHGLHFVKCERKDEMKGKGYITVKEYAEKHSLTSNSVKQRIFNGKLPYIKVGEGNTTRIYIKENEPWVALKPGRKPNSQKSI